MLKNIKNLAISKQLLISLLLITLMFTAAGLCVENSYAVDLNETVESVDSSGVELDVEDKLGNSQNNEILQATRTLNGGKFSDIQNAVDSASSGDTIKLKGTFVAQSSDDVVKITKKLTITSSSSSKATLDGKSKSNMFDIRSGGAGTKISNLIFKNGYSSNEGGAIRVFAKTVTIDSCQFTSNKAKASSGALHTSYTPEVAEGIVVKNCVFKNNSAATAAGALGVFGYNFKIDRCVFDSNKVSNTKNAYGGAIQVGLDTGRSLGVVSNCNFTNNKATSSSGTSHGGAGCLRNGTSYKNCIFKGNSADHGGAITFHASATLSNCKFYNNKANDYGGALSISLEQKTMVLTISKCVFEKNTAPIGGAAKLDGMNIKIQNSNFTGNTATKYGGAVDIDATGVAISNSNFKDNVANINGGALHIDGKNVNVTGSVFNGNDAIPDPKKLNDGLGGAIYVNSTLANIKNSQFKLNTARNGSAVYYDKSGNKLKMTNNVMSNNQAWVYWLPVSAHDIYYGEVENLKSVIHGGNNIAKYNNLSLSNAVYNAASYSRISINGETPVSGANMNNKLYQDDREYNIKILLTVTHEDGSVVYNKTLSSSYLGEVSASLSNLRPGLYTVKSTHSEDTYYKGITNTTTFRVIPMVDNKILKSAPVKDEFNYKDLVMWTLNITNNGPNDATEVVVNDILPKGVIYVSDDSGGKYDNKTGKLIIGNLTVGKSIIVNILTKINKTGLIINEANVTGKEYDTNLTNNQDNASIMVNPAIDLAVVKSVNNSRPNYGDIIDWTVKVKNNGPDVAHDVKVYDKLPDSLIYQRAVGSYDVNSGYWNVGTLNVGSEVTLHLICKVNATGTIRNNVSTSGREKDHDLSNNNASAVITVPPASDLWIDKSVNVSSANYRDLVKWTLVISNKGPDKATGVYVMDTLPKGFDFVEFKAAKGTYSNGKITVGNLAVGERLTFEIVCRVNATGSFKNVANVTGNEYDIDLTNNKDEAPILIYPACDLEVIKEVNKSNPNYGDLIDWTITVKNNGPDIAHDVKVYDILSNALIYQNASGNYNNNTGLWSIGTLNVGSIVKLHIVCKVNATGKTINNVNVTGREYDYNLKNNNDTAVISVPPASDLWIDKSVNVSSANYRDLVKWTLVISNKGPDKATGVYVMDTLPKGFEFVGFKATRGTYSNGKITVGNLAVGERLTFEIVCRVNATGSFKNVANVTGNEYDIDLTNNKDEAPILIYPACDLEVIKEVNESEPKYSKLIKWTITVKNNGPDIAHDVKVYDALPKSLIWIEDDSNGKYNHNNDLWTIGQLSKGNSVKLNIICRVNATGNITNYVNVTGREYDYDLTNNEDNETIKVEKAADLGVNKVVNNSAPNYKEYIRWTVTITNSGPDNATNVNVRENLPNGLILINFTTTKGSYNNGVWSLSSLNKNEVQILEMICQVNKTGNLTNLVTISGKEYDHNPSNNADNETINVPPAVDLELNKDVDNKEPYFGETIVWSVTLKNNGPDNATEVVVSDELPHGAALVNYKSSKGSYADGKWIVGNINVGEIVSLNISCILEDLGEVTNYAEATSKEYDWNKNNNYDSSDVEVLPVADLSLIKLVDEINPNYGDLVTWTLIVTNNGPNDATNVVLYDILPEGLEFIESNSDSYSDGVWDIGYMEVGDTQELEIICKVSKTGTFVNNANVIAEEFDPDLSNNEANESIIVPPASDLSITKIANKYYYTVGDLVEYTIEIVNNGPDKAKNVKVKEILGDSLELASFKASAGDFDKVGKTWSIDSLGVGESASLKIKAIAKKKGVAKNTVSASSDTYDPDLSNNDDFAIVDVEDEPLKTPKNPKNNKDVVKNEYPQKIANTILEKNVSGNSVFVLLVSLIFSLVFLGDDFFKKR